MRNTRWNWVILDVALPTKCVSEKMNNSHVCCTNRRIYGRTIVEDNKRIVC